MFEIRMLGRVVCTTTNESDARDKALALSRNMICAIYYREVGCDWVRCENGQMVA